MTDHKPLSEGEMMGDPMEALLSAALARAGMRFKSGDGGRNPSGLDFRLENGVEIEVKQFHSPRIAEQMSRAPNVIAVQGEAAVTMLADLFAAVAALRFAEAYVGNAVNLAVGLGQDGYAAQGREHLAVMEAALKKLPALNNNASATPKPLDGEAESADTDDLVAGYKFRETMIPRADGERGGAPIFHGWVIMEAFLAGAKHARSTQKEATDTLSLDEFAGIIYREAVPDISRLVEWCGLSAESKVPWLEMAGRIAAKAGLRIVKDGPHA